MYGFAALSCTRDDISMCLETNGSSSPTSVLATQSSRLSSDLQSSQLVPLHQRRNLCSHIRCLYLNTLLTYTSSQLVILCSLIVVCRVFDENKWSEYDCRLYVVCTIFLILKWLKTLWFCSLNFKFDRLFNIAPMRVKKFSEFSSVILHLHSGPCD